MIDILASPSFNKSDFRLKCKRNMDCIEEQNVQSEKHLRVLGFEKVEVLDPETKSRCHLYVRSPITVLQEQISHAKSPSMIFNREDCPSAEQYSHPMTADLGLQAVNEVQNEIMNHKGNDLIWHCRDTSLEISFVGLVQLYSDKSQNSLKASSFQFYPLNITLLNFSDEHRKKCIVEGKTFRAFLPVHFFTNPDDHLSANDERKFGRIQRLRLLHISIDLVLANLKKRILPWI